ncbi:DUF5808 domain-containing protein [Aciduricibacillus chroicocephali]|uniref:DUF5808 domain-containing protein n=1 Tax=Aciduricibacillus chroicocephali TaxID=3054939 RepID=A0ABY9KW26_9BACI|nr:DUF5808 domain-containing protein [Bacillaceae bacterium 44XB]
MDGTILLITVLLMVPVNFILAITPYITRQTEVFGVIVGGDYVKDALFRKWRRQFAVTAGIVQFLLIIVFVGVEVLGSMDENSMAILFSIVLLCQIIAVAIIYMIFHKKMKELKKTQPELFRNHERVRISTNFRKQKLTVSNYWFLIPTFITVVTILVTYRMYGQIPDRIPLQYNLNGEAVEFTEKSKQTAFMLPAIQLSMTVLFLFINIIIRKAKQQVEGRDMEADMQRNVIFRYRWSIFLLFTAVLLVLMFATIQASLIWTMPEKLLIIMPFLFTAIILGATIYLTITTGQGGSRIRIEGETASPDSPYVGRDEDKYWKFGLFYFNKNDPSIFVEKRFGIGWTNNWAHPISWLFIIIVIILAVGLPLFLAL